MADVNPERLEPITTETTPSWEDYFMGMAILSGYRSKDKNYQVGACIVNKEKRIISTGFNGYPDCHREAEEHTTPNEEHFPDWSEKEKHKYVCHAELNAIVNAKTDVKDATMYVTRYPCSECAKLIVQSEIEKVFYLEPSKEKEGDFAGNTFNFAKRQIAKKRKITLEDAPNFVEKLEIKSKHIIQMSGYLRNNAER